MKKIMFVCHGNICRSPMAEIIFRDLAEKRGVADRYYVASSATSSEEIWNGVGNPVYPPAREMLRRHGIDCGGKRARLLVKEDYSRYNLLIGMDSANIRNMLRILGGDPDGKVRRLLDGTPRPRDVADPWYTGNFEEAYADVLRGCTALLKRLTQ